MRLFILAAGVGSRLFPLTKNTPKSLLDMGDGSSILERQIESAIDCSEINSVSVVTGYKTEQIEARVHSLRIGIPIDIIYNPFFDVSNNLISLWCAAHQMLASDFIVTNGDNIYCKDVFPAVIPSTDGIYLTIDKKESYDDDDMKVTLDGHDTVKRVHKDIAPQATHAESVGLAVVRGEQNRAIFQSEIYSLVRDKRYINRFWLETFNSLAHRGATVHTTEISHEAWREIDFHPDFDSLRKMVLDNIF